MTTPHRHEDCCYRCFHEDELGVERCCYDGSTRNARAIDYRTQPPLIAGGQGRSAHEVEQTARCMMRLAVFVGITLFCLAAWALVARLCGII